MISLALGMTAVVVAVFVLLVRMVPPLVIRYRITDRAVETRLFGQWTVQRLPLDEVEGQGDVRVATWPELLRTGEYWRAARVGRRGMHTRVWGPVVAIRRRGGAVAVYTPPDPHLFVRKVREKMPSLPAAVPSLAAVSPPHVLADGRGL